ncbi:molybdopterin-dependent oxidoreductase [Cryptosporangium phraense]|uniref:Molybdopterin-dependent oxidoreductase n=1 Tax=Cryptosporangium phraense TaxID=2593070 RepID=A0A545AF65_9ACTN|nr:molybdopterin-dependent oxidoreductase [Cryptosporangium phraense]TQS39964.1 molybdopterin-dependent oxidoreductase [Cryptosporangium phraense]
MRTLGFGALTGVSAAVAALGVAEPVAAGIGRGSSPVVAVGLAFIDLVPRPVKDFGIETFGQNDKVALLSGVFVILAIFAVVCGVVSLRRRLLGAAGVALFGVVGVVAAVTRPDAGPLASLPAVVGAAAGVGVLLFLAPRAAAAASARPPIRSSKLESPTEPTPVGESRLRAESATGGADAMRTKTPDGVRRGTTATSRRGFLLVSGSVLAVSAGLGAAGRYLTSLRDVTAERLNLTLPAAADPTPPLPTDVDLKLPDLTPFLTPDKDFYRVDTALAVPQLSTDDYRLKIHGRVRNPMTITYQDLLDRPLVERVITLSCVSNEVGGTLAGTARWLGVPLKALLDEVQPENGADQIVTKSVDGWTCGTPTSVVRDGRDALIVVGMNGKPLPIERGYPVRMLVPGLYGYVSATKWLVDLELTSFADFDPYWVKRGWKAQAPIKTFSRIDTPRPLASSKAGPIAVAGVAWAQHRGIERVEVRVDGGAWNTATLAPVPSEDTWRQWRWDWDATKATPGQHTLEVRATDRTAATQPERRAKPFPDGATGWHSVVVTVE